MFSLERDVPNGTHGSYVRTYLVWAGFYWTEYLGLQHSVCSFCINTYLINTFNVVNVLFFIYLFYFCSSSGARFGKVLQKIILRQWYSGRILELSESHLIRTIRKAGRGEKRGEGSGEFSSRLNFFLSYFPFDEYIYIYFCTPLPA